jgi:transcriptional regulator GlxA family with amidase domain
VRFHRSIEDLVAGRGIAAVARAAGYRSASAYSAAFRKSMGAPPSALWRRGRPHEDGDLRA